MAYRINENCNGCTACALSCPTRAISGAKKELHKIDPELCVECGVCGRVCNFAAVLNPEGELCTPVKRSEWSKPQPVGKRCVACHQCVDACPWGCLELQLTEKSKHKHPLVVLTNPKRCVACGLCVEICPMDYLALRPPAQSAA